MQLPSAPPAPTSLFRCRDLAAQSQVDIAEKRKAIERLEQRP
jgi:hypothetical protein